MSRSWRRLVAVGLGVALESWMPAALAASAAAPRPQQDRVYAGAAVNPASLT